MLERKGDLATVLTGERNDVVNSFDRPASVAPVTETIPGIGPSFGAPARPALADVPRIGGEAVPGAPAP